MKSARMLPWLAVLVSVFLCRPTWAQDFPEAPSSHRFMDRTNKILFSIHAGLEVTDFAITHRNLSQGGREMDSMARPFCERGTPGQLAFFGGRMAGVVGISYLLHKTGHHRVERAFIVYASGDSAYGVGYSLAHR